MKKLLYLSFSFLLLFSACQKTDSNLLLEANKEMSKGPAGKVTICHKASDGKVIVLEVSQNALAAHLAHGDSIPDSDGDGYTAIGACTGSADDCNDNDASINPGAKEVCGDGIDNNCNGQTDEGCLVIGANYGGGVIAYILKPDDPGYVANEIHGIIAATSAQSYAAWAYGVRFFYFTGATETALGSGQWNTDRIVARLGRYYSPAYGAYAALYCDDLFTEDGNRSYEDWHLPSKDELNKLYENREAIGGFSDDYYWSSSENLNTRKAWAQSLQDGSQTDVFYKFIELAICPVRYF